MTFGFLMLGLSCLSAYFYYHKFHANSSGAQVIEGPWSSELSQESSRLKTEALKSRPATIENARIGSLVRIDDVGLQMIRIDGKIVSKNLLKKGLDRSYEVIVDDGRQKFRIFSQNLSPTFVCVKEISSFSLGISNSDFVSLRDSALTQINLDGCSYTFKSSFAANFCLDENELEPSPRLVWIFEEATEAFQIRIFRKADGTLENLLLSKTNPQQISLLDSSRRP